MDKKRKWEQIGVRRLSTTKDLEKNAHMNENLEKPTETRVTLLSHYSVLNDKFDFDKISKH